MSINATNSTVNNNCPDGIDWAWNVLEECVTTTRDKVSIAFGILSIVAWFAFGFPQMVTNCMKKIPDQAVSPFLLLFWLLGDTLNFIGAFLARQLFLQKVLAAYTVLIDIILIIQFIYYYDRHKRILKRKIDFFSDTSSYVMSAAPKYLATAIAGCVAFTFFFESLPAKLPQSGTISSNHILGRQLLQLPEDTEPDKWADFLNTTEKKIGYSIGWVSAAMYVFSRLPQIYQNFRRKSTEGLSIVLFVLAVFGNICYGLQIFIKSTELVKIVSSLPWIVGSFGIIIFDFIILIQFILFRQPDLTISITDLDIEEDLTNHDMEKKNLD